jgi:hypothetical protein
MARRNARGRKDEYLNMIDGDRVPLVDKILVHPSNIINFPPFFLLLRYLIRRLRGIL